MSSDNQTSFDAELSDAMDDQGHGPFTHGLFASGHHDNPFVIAAHAMHLERMGVEDAIFVEVHDLVTAGTDLSAFLGHPPGYQSGHQTGHRPGMTAQDAVNSTGLVDMLFGDVDLEALFGLDADGLGSPETSEADEPPLLTPLGNSPDELLHGHNFSHHLKRLYRPFDEI